MCAHVCYLSLRVASPCVDVPSGGEHQGVLSAHGDVLDEDPRQSGHLLGSVVVPRTALRQTNQTVLTGAEGNK